MIILKNTTNMILINESKNEYGVESVEIRIVNEDKTMAFQLDYWQGLEVINEIQSMRLKKAEKEGYSDPLTKDIK